MIKRVIKCSVCGEAAILDSSLSGKFNQYYFCERHHHMTTVIPDYNEPDKLADNLTEVEINEILK
jgi:hypothetical protein